MDRDTVVRKGDTYCSERCGGDCTFDQYAAMKKQAEKMCKELGEGWKPQLNHNLGWFCAVVNSHATIHYCDDRSGVNRPSHYSAWVEFDLGEQCCQFINEHEDIHKALSKSIQEARQFRDAIKKEINLLEI